MLSDPKEALLRLDSLSTPTSLSLAMQVRKHSWSATAMGPNSRTNRHVGNAGNVILVCDPEIGFKT